MGFDVAVKIVGFYYFKEFEFEPQSRRNVTVLEVMRAAERQMGNPSLKLDLDARGFMRTITVNHSKSPLSSKLDEKNLFTRDFTLPTGDYTFNDTVDLDKKGPQLVWQYYIFRDYDAEDITDAAGNTQNIITSLGRPTSQDGRITKMANARVRERDLVLWRLVGITFGPANMSLRQMGIENGLSNELLSGLEGEATRPAVARLRKAMAAKA